MGRTPNAYTPLTIEELHSLQVEIRKKSMEQLCREYEQVLGMAKLYGRTPCQPFVIQTLVQIWRELDRRTAKGR